MLVIEPNISNINNIINIINVISNINISKSKYSSLSVLHRNTFCAVMSLYLCKLATDVSSSTERSVPAANQLLKQNTNVTSTIS